MVKPITARVNCDRCRRRVRLPESIVSELAYRLTARAACPECGGEIQVLLRSPRARRESPIHVAPPTPPPSPVAIQPELPAPMPVELPFRPLVEAKATPAMDVPFAPMRLDSSTSKQGGVLGWWTRIPVIHRATWVAAAIVVVVALCWPSAKATRPAPEAPAEARQ